MTHVETVSVSDFISRCVGAAGGMVETRPDGLLDALLPEPFTASVGGRGLVTLALDSDALAMGQGAEPATIGSPFVDSLIAFASGRGNIAAARITPTWVRKKGLREALEREVTFLNCRVREDDRPPVIRDSFYVLFDFRLTYISDERREQLLTVPVDLHSLQINHLLAERLGQVLIEPDDPPPPGAFRTESVAAAYERAKEMVRQRAFAECLAFQTRLTKRFEVEHGRVSGYYRQIDDDLTRREAAESDSGKIETLRRKREAARLELDAKIREITDKYRVHPRATVVSIRLVAQAKTCFSILIDRGPVTRSLEVRFDSVLDRIDPPVCEKCGFETARVYVDPKSNRLCPACSGKG